MKLLIASLFISVLYTSCCVIPEHGIAYTRITYYQRVRERKNPIIYLDREFSISMYYNHRRKQVWYECTINNESKDSLVFNTCDYYMCSGNMEFALNPIHYDINKPFRCTRSLKLAPGASQRTVLSFDSNKKITRQEYENHVYNDSVYLVYSDKTIKDTILSAIGLNRRY